MMSTFALILFITSLFIQITFIFIKIGNIKNIAYYFLLVISGILLAELTMRSIAIKFVALTNIYESLLFFSAIICLLIFIFNNKAKEMAHPYINLIGTVIAFTLFALTSSPIASDVIKPPVPALQSHWLILHVSFSFIGESFFVLGFGAAIMYLFSKNEERKVHIDKLMYTAITLGYIIFTVGALIFGAVWAQFAWGRFWAWDPKETFALITWLIYTLYLHFRFIKKIDNKITAIIVIVGFLMTIFTFFGVNFLTSSVHSYK